MNEYELDYDFIDLKKAVPYLLKRSWLLLISGLMGALLVFGFVWFFVKPTYESKAVFYVSNNSDKEKQQNQYYTTENLSAAQSLVETYSVILMQYHNLQTVIDRYQLPYTYEQLTKMVSVQSENKTEIFSVTVTSTSPEEAVTIVNGIANVLPQTIASVMSGASVQIIDRGRFNDQQVAPNYKEFVLIGFIAGVVFMTVLLLILCFTDKKIHDENFIGELSESEALLAIIPELPYISDLKTNRFSFGNLKKRKGKTFGKLTDQDLFLCNNLPFSAIEAYKLLRTNVLYSLTDKKECYVIGITSSVHGETKSTTAINLAYTFAEAGNKVLIIDGDMRLPTVSKRLNLREKPGLSNILGGFNVKTNSHQKVQISQYWYAITAGDIPPNPSKLLESVMMKETLDRLRKSYDYIIIDLPPVNVVTDALAVSPYLDGMLMVVRENYTNLLSLRNSIEKLQLAKVNLLGFVLTCSVSYKKNAYYRKRGINKNAYATNFAKNQKKQEPKSVGISKNAYVADYDKNQEGKDPKTIEINKNVYATDNDKNQERQDPTSEETKKVFYKTEERITDSDKKEKQIPFNAIMDGYSADPFFYETEERITD